MERFEKTLMSVAACSLLALGASSCRSLDGDHGDQPADSEHPADAEHPADHPEHPAGGGGEHPDHPQA